MPDPEESAVLVASSPTQTPSPMTAPTPGLTKRVAAMDNEHQLLMTGHQQMLEAHQSFLAAQVEGQRAFMESMARIQSSLFDEPAAMTTPVVEPAAHHGAQRAEHDRRAAVMRAASQRMTQFSASCRIS